MPFFNYLKKLAGAWGRPEDRYRFYFLCNADPILVTVTEVLNIFPGKKISRPVLIRTLASAMEQAFLNPRPDFF